jgi:hypothetical protein
VYNEQRQLTQGWMISLLIDRLEHWIQMLKNINSPKIETGQTFANIMRHSLNPLFTASVESGFFHHKAVIVA